MKTPTANVATHCYLQQLRHAQQKFHWLRQGFPGLPIVFLCHPIRSNDSGSEHLNLVRMARTIIWLNRMTGLVIFNQLPFNALFCPDDPRNFDLKTTLFYHKLIDASDIILVACGYQDSEGCQKELAYARQQGKTIYFLSNIDILIDLQTPERIAALTNEELRQQLDFSGECYFSKVPAQEWQNWKDLVQ